MGRTKAIDNADLQEVLSLRDDFGVLQKDNSLIRTEVAKLQNDVQSMSKKQWDIALQVGDVEQAIIYLSKQLSAISTVLKNMVQPTTSQQTDKQLPSSS